MTEVKSLEQRIVRCTLDLVLVNERLRESECDPEGYGNEQEGTRLQRRRTELLSELEMLGNMRRIDQGSVEGHVGG
jgi:hypothetical protein